MATREQVVSRPEFVERRAEMRRAYAELQEACRRLDGRGPGDRSCVGTERGSETADEYLSFTLTPSAARGLATFDPGEQARLREIWTEHGISPSMIAYLETRDPTAPPAPAWPDVIEYQPPVRESWALPRRTR